MSGDSTLNKSLPTIDCHTAPTARPVPRVAVSTLGFICVTVCWFALLGGRSLFDPDEGRYAEIPREMLQLGDWLIPHLNGIPYLEKPPLQYWLTALSFQCFGENEWAARLCTGLAGYLSLVILFWVGRRLGGDVAGLKAVALTGASILFVLLGHQATLDMLLSFCLLAALGCFLIAQIERENRAACRSWMLGCWGAMAFAVLSKGLVGIVIPACTAIVYVLWQRDFRLFRELNLRWGLTLFLAIAAPWFLMVARADERFLQFFFFREHVQRFLTSIEHRTAPGWFFFAVLAVGIMPWLPLALKSLYETWRYPRSLGRFDPRRVLAIWSLFIVLFFSASDSKLIPYILPAVPALALLCACRSARQDRGCLSAGAWLSIAACMGTLCYSCGAWGSLKVQDLALDMQPALWCTAGLLFVSGAACLALTTRRLATEALLILCLGWFLSAAGLLVAAREGEQFFSSKDFAEIVQDRVPPTVSLYSVRMYDQSVPFYLARTVTLVDYRDELAFGLDENPTLGIADLSRFGVEWRGLHEGYAIMRRATRDLLQSQSLPMREVVALGDRVLISRQ